jgi:hypothetical protein
MTEGIEQTIKVIRDINLDLSQMRLVQLEDLYKQVDESAHQMLDKYQGNQEVIEAVSYFHMLTLTLITEAKFLHLENQRHMISEVGETITPTKLNP